MRTIRLFIRLSNEFPKAFFEALFCAIGLVAICASANSQSLTPPDAPLVPQTAPSAQARSAGEIQTVAKGLAHSIRPSTTFVIAKNADQWAAAWMLLASDSDGYVRSQGWLQWLPPVEFDRSMVIGIVLATNPDSCTGVTISEASVAHQKIVVTYSERRRRTDIREACASTLTTGYHFVSLPKSPLTIEFVDADAAVTKLPERLTLF